MNDSFAAWNELAISQWKCSSNQRWFHDFILYPAICKRLELHSRVLDYGCGSGELLAVMRQIGHEVIGVDPSIEMVRKAQVLNPDVKILNDCSPLFNESFNTVILNLVLSCVQDAVGVLRVVSAYAPRIIVTVPHPCFSLFTDLHTTTRRAWAQNIDISDERTLYFKEPTQSIIWDDAGIITTMTYYRSITTWFRLFQKCELHVSDISEPVPVKDGTCIPKLYERWNQMPAFMLFDLHKK